MENTDCNLCEPSSQLDFAKVLGNLIYVMNFTRPYIACAISKLSRYTSNPNQSHWLTMKRVLGYLDDTQNYALHYNRYQSFLKDIVMQIGLLDQLKQNPQVDTFLLLVEEKYLEIIQTNMYSSLYNVVWIHCFRQGRWRSWMAPEFVRRYSILAQTNGPYMHTLW